VVVPITIPKESSKNNAEEIDEVIDSVEVTDAPEGAQGAITINTGAVKAVATKVAKAKLTIKKGAYQTSLGSIAKNRPKRACTLKRTICGQPIVEAPRKFSQSCIAKNRPRRTCTLKSTSLRQPMVEAFRKVLTDSLVSQKHMSDFFPKK
jgi:hypothetical protein